MKTRFDIYKFKKNSKPISDINVTPLVDVMLVLLIVFMITAPLLTVGVEVNLPQSEASEISKDQKPIIISYKSNGSLYIEDKKYSKQNLIKKIVALQTSNANLITFIRADQKLSYGKVMKLMGELSSLGIDKLTLLTKTDLKR